MDHKRSKVQSPYEVTVYNRPQRSWDKVIFSQACVILFTGGCMVPGEGCMVLGEWLGGAWSRAAWSRGCTGGALSGWGAWSGGCMVPGGLVEKPPADPPRRPLLRAVRILLECILVLNLICCMAHMSVIFDLQESTTAKCSRQQRPVCCCLQ